MSKIGSVETLILQNKIIFNRSRATGLVYYVNGIKDPEKEVKIYFGLVSFTFSLRVGSNIAKRISLEEIFDYVEDVKVKEEILFHLDELKKLKKR